MAKRNRHRMELGSCGDESSDSLEEITADDFKRRDVRDTARSRSRVWMDSERVCLERIDGLQNKPIGLELMPMTAGDLARFDGNEEEDNVDLVINVSSQELDCEKEDGESEEGEVQSVNRHTDKEMVGDQYPHKIDKEVVVTDGFTDKFEDVDALADKLEEDETDMEFVEIESEDSSEVDKNVSVILEELQTITAEVVEASFDAVCSKLLKCFENMKIMFEGVGSIDPVLISLVHQAFSSIGIIYSVLNSKNLIKKEKNNELFSRLLMHIKNKHPILLIPEHINQIDELLKLRVSEDDKKEKELSQSGTNINGQSLNTGVYFKLDPSTVNILGSKDGMVGLLKLDIKSARTGFSPLLDLHGDHDEGSLPSPTGESPSQFPASKTVCYGIKESVSSPSVAKDVEAVADRNQFYVNEALKAVSSYEKKYGRISFPESPTPSEDGQNNEDVDDDSYADISTFITSDPAVSNALGQFQALNTNTSSTKITMRKQDGPVNILSQVGSNKPALKLPSKSRDPRLKFLKPEICGAFKPNTFVPGMSGSGDTGLAAGLMNDKKPKAVDESAMDNCALKRQGDGFDSSKDCYMQCSRGSWLEDRNQVTSQSGKQLQTVDNLLANTNTSSVDVVPAFVSGVATNPVQPDEAGTVPLATSRMKAGGNSLKLNINVGRQMKPRDPRRILYKNTLEENENLDSEHMENGVAFSDACRSTCGSKHLSFNEQVAVAQPKFFPCQSLSKPESNRHLTKNLKLLADSDEHKTGSAATSEGVDISNLQSAYPWADVDHLLEGYNDKQKATIQSERARRIDEQNKMFAAKKLCLVLDLDHTLLNSAKFAEVEPIHEEILRRKEVLDKEKPLRHLLRLQHMGMWTKLRPGVWNFLEKASKLYELHLYTMGNKLYATEMAKVLDPTGTLFSGRVMSKGDDFDSLDGDASKSKDLEGVLGMESAVVIIDDTLRVWPHNKHNLIVVERYTYFPCSRRQFGLLGPSLLEIDRDERPEDGTLASALAVIERVHERFFSHDSLSEVDVRNILASEKQKILRGCKIVFSRIIPVAEKKPHLHPLWKMAEQFGAVCTTLCDSTVTHVVANSLGTEKVNWAFKKKKFVVHPGWLEASAVLYRRANENDFAVTQLIS